MISSEAYIVTIVRNTYRVPYGPFFNLRDAQDAAAVLRKEEWPDTDPIEVDPIFGWDASAHEPIRFWPAQLGVVK